MGTNDERITELLRQKARELLESGAVSCVIGYEKGSLQVRPSFVYEPAEAERLVWNADCTQNLVKYLHDKKGKKVAVVVKPCDARALNVLLQESQIKRDEVFVIGVACEGVEHEGQPEPRCTRCSERTPVVYDALLGEPPKVEPVQDDYADLAELDAMTPQERAAFWDGHFERCLRCYACRQACFGCYCFECVSEQLNPAWQSIAISLPEKRFFHTMRAYHLAGRCIGCNACERACPAGIPLSLLNRSVAREVARLFDNYEAGTAPDTRPPLATFKKEELESR